MGAGPRALLVGLAVMAGLLAGCGATTTPTPGATTAPTAPPLDAAAIAGGITEAGLRARMDALASVTTGSAAFRAIGSSGFDAAADLVAGELRAAGWTVTDDRFTTPAFADPGGSALVVDGRSFGVADLRPLIFAPAGDVSGAAFSIDWDPDAHEATGKGCAAADYAGLPHGAIVLVRPGPCFRRAQIMVAQDAGAVGFVAGYPWAASGEVLRPTLIEPTGLRIPAAAASRVVGAALAAAALSGASIRLTTHAETKPSATRSVIGELAGSQPDKVVMLGAHLDSVIDGPGINDNGSGVAALLEIARALRGSHPLATIRLAFWTAEEPGLHGSTHYVAGLPAGGRDAIVAYLNADMLASPNGFAGVYDSLGAPAGSATVRDLVSQAVTRAGGTPVMVDPGSGSDHTPFAGAGIAIGGVYAGARELVTEDQAAASGSTAGQPADACYHLACDDGSDVDLRLARILTAALVDVAVQIADDPTRAVH